MLMSEVPWEHCDNARAVRGHGTRGLFKGVSGLHLNRGSAVRRGTGPSCVVLKAVHGTAASLWEVTGTALVVTNRTDQQAGCVRA